MVENYTKYEVEIDENKHIVTIQIIDNKYYATVDNYKIETGYDSILNLFDGYVFIT